MKSPFSDNVLEVLVRLDTIDFRGIPYLVNYHYYSDNGIEFTTEELDNINLNQIPLYRILCQE